MSQILRFPELALGELEQQVLEALWAHSPQHPSEVHAAVGVPRGVSANTVSSALKRLYESCRAQLVLLFGTSTTLRVRPSPC